MRIIGIDPGLDGACAVVYDEGRRFDAFHFPKVKLKGRGYDPHWDAMVEDVERLAFEADHAFIEKVNARPLEARSSSFKFGVCAGGVRAMMALLRVPASFVTPAAWKLSMRLGRADKSLSIRRAKELFPDDLDQMEPIYGKRNTKQIEGIAEAALIGYYGYKILLNGGHYDVIK